MDIIMIYIAFAGITDIDNIYGAAIRHFQVRASLTDDITLEEQNIRDKFLSYTREPFKGKKYKGNPINEPPKDADGNLIVESEDEKDKRVMRKEMRKSTLRNPIPKGKALIVRIIHVTHVVERIFFKSMYFYLFPYFVIPISYYVF